MSEQAADSATVRELQDRLEALALLVGEQQATIARLERGATASASLGTGHAGSGSKFDRRGMLTKVVGATAAAAVLSVAKDAATAYAGTNATITGASTANYGALAQAGTGAPSPIPTLNGTYGVVGLSDAASFPTIPSGGGGVLGVASGITAVRGVSASGTGVSGGSNTGVGVTGASGSNIGVYGASSSNVGVYGDASFNTAVNGRTQTGIGIYGTATNPGGGGRAAVFDGTVLVNGPFTVVGGPKSAGVRHPDGSVRRVYCQESPEPWFEDFGTATLRGGRAEIALDPDFDAVVKGDDYLVFLTPEGNCEGLYVSRKGPHRFVVEELRGGKATVPFSYRLVSRRREDVGKRLEKVDVRPAQSKDVQPPDLSKPATPASGEGRSR